MPHSSHTQWTEYFQKPFVTLSIAGLGVLLCCIGLLLLASYHSSAAFASLQTGDFATAKQYADRSRPIVNIFNTATLGLVPDLVAWKEALQLPLQLDTLITTAITVAEHSFQSEDSVSITTLSPAVTDLANTLTKLDQKLPYTILLKQHIPNNVSQKIPFIIQGLNETNTFIDSVSQGKQTWVVLLQNSDELRATGGFPGSYVLLNFNNGVLTEMVVEDIYDADGQFRGFVAPPAGIREYTSSNNGLRLPDANWWPDFPTSAQTMLQFFALGDKNNIAGMIAINLQTAKSILSVTGPLWLPDYNIEVTDENIGEVLRAERSEFFPGSTQKKDLLNLTLVQIKQKIFQLNNQQQLQLFSELRKKISEKEIQLYSTRPHLQEIFSQYHLSGELTTTAVAESQSITECNCQPVAIALVESNVGINKVNKYVTRSNSLSFEKGSLTITTTFTNNASKLSSTELSYLVGLPAEVTPRNGNGYLNYYRLLVSPEYIVKSVAVGEQTISQWDEEVITTASGAELLQIGVLAGVQEKSNTTVSFQLTSTRTTVPEAIVLFKQSGVPPSTYFVKTPTKSSEFQLETDQVVLL